MKCFKFIILLFAICHISYISAQVRYLPEVYVDAQIVSQHGDTIAYRVSALKTDKDRNLEDLLRRIPGIEIQTNGTITYEEKPITHFYIEGLDLLSGRYSVATQHINVEDLSTIEVLENHQHIKLLKNYIPTNRAAINIKLKKKSLQRPIGSILAGVGLDAEAKMEEQVDANIMTISSKLQTMLTLQQNNRWEAKESRSDLFDIVEDNSASESPFESSILGTPSISKKRYLNDDVIEGQVNILRKISDKKQIRVIAGFSKDDIGYEQSRYAQYFADSNYVDENVCSDLKIKKRQALIQVFAENNSDSSYFKHTSTLKIKDSKNTDYLSINDIQNMNIKGWRYMGDYTQICKRSWGIQQIDAKVTAASEPVDLLYRDVSQKYKSTIFQGDVATSVFWSIKNNSVGIEMRLSANRNFLDSEQNDTLHFQDRNLQNEVDFFSASLCCTPFLQIVKSFFNLRIGLPVSYTYLTSENSTFGIKQTQRPLKVGVNIKSAYKLSPTMRIEMSLAEDSWHGTAEDLAIAPVRTSAIHERILGNGTLVGGDRLNANISYSYRNPFNGISANISAKGNIIWQKQYEASNYIEPVFFQYNVDGFNRIKQFQFDGSLFKNFFDYEWTLRSSIHHTIQEKDLIRNMQLINCTEYSTRVSLESEKFFWNCHLCWIVQGQYSNNNAQYVSRDLNDSAQKIRDQFINLSNRLWVNIANHWDITVSSETQWNENSDWQVDNYLDATARWHTTKHEIELKVNNITDEKTWKQVQISGLNRFVYDYSLRRRDITISYKYNF